MLRAIRKFPLINPALALRRQTYAGPKDSAWSSADKAYALLFESGQGTQHYVYINSLESYISFMRNYANLTQVFDSIVKPIIDKWEREKERRSATVGGGYGMGPSDMY
ncbi:hypothetical protein KSC_066050 [Ktedonobacter sp. SOSP1-52]|nr:hypothetical protein KSC_066050 [Ktedonobacter sp. SOSP1-52]